MYEYQVWHSWSLDVLLGYYLGAGAMSREELQIAFNALTSITKYQGNPQVRYIYQTHTERLRGLELELNCTDAPYWSSCVRSLCAETRADPHEGT